MRPGFAVACAMAVPLLTFTGQGLHAQDVWPPDDDGPPPQQQAYPQPGGAQPGYGQQNPQQAYGAPGYGQQPNSYPQPGYEYNQGSRGLALGDPIQPGAMQPMSPEQLDQLVAPIALYPDQVLAEILTASTYPAQISAADQWLRSMGNAPPEQVAAGANEQTAWDPSVKALTAFPQVLAMLDSNLRWTTALGNAYYNQPQDVLQTVQVLRQRAEQAGNLQSTPQEQVVDNPGYVSLAPTNPDVVYVPTYNPWAVYGAPVAPYPGFSFEGEMGSFIGTGLQYGLSFGMGAFVHTPFGLLAWGLDWLANSILFNHQGYWSHSGEMRDWGFAHGGPRYGGWYQHGGWRNGGTQMARFGDYHNQGISVHGGFPPARPGVWNGGQNRFGQGGLNRAGGGFPTARPGAGGQQNNLFGQNGFGQNGFNRGPRQGFNGGYQMGSTAGGYSRAYPGQEQQSFNHVQSPMSHPQQVGGGMTYGGSHTYAGGTNGGGQGFVGRQGGGYGIPRYSVPTQGYRAATQSYGQGGFSRGPAQAYAGGYAGVGHGGSSSYASGYSGSYGGGHAQSFGGGHSGGFHGFGGGHAQSFSSGHSGGFGGGGHSSSHGFGGGSHGGGGGHSSGGGHSHGKH